MFGWIYKLFAANRFRSQASLAFGLIRAFKDQILNRIEEIIVITEANYLKVASFYNKYHVLKNSLEECYYAKDEFDFVTKFNDPIISPIQEGRIRKLRIKYWVAIVVFFVVETFLFYMIAENITGGMVSKLNADRTSAKFVAYFLFIASAFFALISAVIFDTGLRQVFQYFKAQKHFDKKFINAAQFRTARVKFYIGISIIVGSVIILFLMNWARSYAIDSTGEDSKSHNPVLVYALIALSVFAGVAWGLVKKEMGDNGELLSLSDKLNKIKKEMAGVQSGLAELSIKIHNQFALTINKSHVLGLELQLLMKREYDERDSALLTEFKNDLKTDNFHKVNDNGSVSTIIAPQKAYYFNNLLTNETILHNYHFSTNERLVEIIADVDRMVKVINDLENARLTKLIGTNPANNNYSNLNKDPEEEVNPQIDERDKQILNESNKPQNSDQLLSESFSNN